MSSITFGLVVFLLCIAMVLFFFVLVGVRACGGVVMVGADAVLLPDEYCDKVCTTIHRCVGAAQKAATHKNRDWTKCVSRQSVRDCGGRVNGSPKRRVSSATFLIFFLSTTTSYLESFSPLV